MANTTIQLKKSSTPAASPSVLANGEIAINYADGKIFYKNATGQIVSFSASGGTQNTFSTINANGTLIVTDSPTDILTLSQGSNIIITGDAINDIITLSADLSPANNWANTVAGSLVKIQNTAPSSSNTKFWYHSGVGKLFISYTDSNSTQWVDTSSGQYTPLVVDVTSSLRTINSNSSINITDSYILAAGNVTLTLPAVSTASGRQYKIKNIGTGDITLQGDATIDGKSNTIIGEQYTALILLSTGVEWYIF
jgi:hypothetical protein